MTSRDAASGSGGARRRRPSKGRQPKRTRAPREKRSGKRRAPEGQAEERRAPSEGVLVWPQSEEGPAAGGEAPAPLAPDQGPPSYRQDGLAALVALLLAISVFFPWYSRGPFRATGWATGTWGPPVFFLALLALALILLRRAGVRVSLPFEEPLLIEAAGWASAIMIAIKAIRPPSIAFVRLAPTWGVWVALLAAIGLATVAGRMSPHAPLVFLPAWYRGKAGRVGALALVAALGASLAFGLGNDPSVQAPSAGGVGSPPEPIRGRLPECAQAFPMPGDLEPVLGFDASPRTSGACIAQLHSDAKVSVVARRFRGALRAARWRFSDSGRGGPDVALYQITRPRCGSVLVTRDPQRGGSSVTLTLNPCPRPPG